MLATFEKPLYIRIDQRMRCMGKFLNIFEPWFLVIYQFPVRQPPDFGIIMPDADRIQQIQHKIQRLLQHIQEPDQVFPDLPVFRHGFMFLKQLQQRPGESLFQRKVFPKETVLVLVIRYSIFAVSYYFIAQ